jgi:hypothetical protein
MSDDRFSRRRVLRASAVAAAGFGGLGTAAAEPGDGAGAGDLGYERVPCLDLTDAEFRTESASQTAVPEQASGIRTGSQMFINYPDGTTAGCTANFIWRDVDSTNAAPPGGPNEFPGQGEPPENSHWAGDDGGGDLYIGAAGHCFLPDVKNASQNAKRGDEAEEDVYDVSQLTVEVCADCLRGGANGLVVQGETVELGEVVYARQNLPDGSEVGHDFGIVRISADLQDAIDPSMPQWGGPDGVSENAVPQGDHVHQYGAGVANGEVFPTMGSTGVSQGAQRNDDSWVATLRASPGDSGSPLVSSDPTGASSTGDDAAGILTHLVLSSDPAGNGAAGTTISRCKEMARADVGIDLEVVLAGELQEGG